MKEVLISNIRGEDEYGQPIFIDRIYGTDQTRRLIQKDGTVYEGTLTKRRITIKRFNGEGSFASHVWETADGRWFDRGGMPIDKPEQLENTKNEEEQSTETTSTDGNTET